MGTGMMDQETPRLSPLLHHTIVVVDDDPAVLSALRRLFRRDAHDIRASLSPDQVLEWIQKDDISLVISDQRMPVTNGIELLKEVRKRSPRTQCVMLTGFASEELSRQAESAGIRSLLSKPWDEVDLKRTVRLLLRERELSA